ncbi:hypothetical protein [Scytonema hofmannii]|nr:hypothetical protein [Scytonema hofmannii]
MMATISLLKSYNQLIDKIAFICLLIWERAMGNGQWAMMTFSG